MTDATALAGSSRYGAIQGKACSPSSLRAIASGSPASQEPMADERSDTSLPCSLGALSWRTRSIVKLPEQPTQMSSADQPLAASRTIDRRAAGIVPWNTAAV
jgi:hypothetical protein